MITKQSCPIRPYFVIILTTLAINFTHSASLHTAKWQYELSRFSYEGIVQHTDTWLLLGGLTLRSHHLSHHHQSLIVKRELLMTRSISSFYSMHRADTRRRWWWKYQAPPTYLPQRDPWSVGGVSFAWVYYWWASQVALSFHVLGMVCLKRMVVFLLGDHSTTSPEPHPLTNNPCTGEEPGPFPWMMHPIW